MLEAPEEGGYEEGRGERGEERGGGGGRFL